MNRPGRPRIILDGRHISFYIDGEAYIRISEIAKADYRPISAVLREVIQRGLGRMPEAGEEPAFTDKDGTTYYN